MLRTAMLFVMVTVLFACVHNAGRSQMAAAFFNAFADPEKAHAQSAGTHPAERVNPTVVQAMREVGLDASGAEPRRLTPGMAAGAHWLITMGCGEECPVVPGAKREEWPLDDPASRSLSEVRRIRDEIRGRVLDFIAVHGWQRR